MVISLERGADLRMARSMPLPLTVSCFSKIRIGFTFLVPPYPGSPGGPLNGCVCVCAWLCDRWKTVMFTADCQMAMSLRMVWWSQRRWVSISRLIPAVFTTPTPLDCGRFSAWPWRTVECTTATVALTLKSSTVHKVAPLHSCCKFLVPLHL